MTPSSRCAFIRYPRPAVRCPRAGVRGATRWHPRRSPAFPLLPHGRFLQTGSGNPSPELRSPAGPNSRARILSFRPSGLAQRRTKFHCETMCGNHPFSSDLAARQIAASLGKPRISPQIMMVSTSASVSFGAGPRSRSRPTSPVTAPTTPSSQQYSHISRSSSSSMDRSSGVYPPDDCPSFFFLTPMAWPCQATFRLPVVRVRSTSAS